MWVYVSLCVRLHVCGYVLSQCGERRRGWRCCEGETCECAHVCVVCVGGWMCASVHCVRDVGVCEWSVCVYVCVYVCVCMCGCMCVCWQEGEGC